MAADDDLFCFVLLVHFDQIDKSNHTKKRGEVAERQAEGNSASCVPLQLVSTSSFSSNLGKIETTQRRRPRPANQPVNATITVATKHKAVTDTKQRRTVTSKERSEEDDTYHNC